MAPSPLLYAEPMLLTAIRVGCASSTKAGTLIAACLALFVHAPIQRFPSCSPTSTLSEPRRNGNQHPRVGKLGSGDSLSAARAWTRCGPSTVLFRTFAEPATSHDTCALRSIGPAGTHQLASSLAPAAPVVSTWLLTASAYRASSIRMKDPRCCNQQLTRMVALPRLPLRPHSPQTQASSSSFTAALQFCTQGLAGWLLCASLGVVTILIFATTTSATRQRTLRAARASAVKRMDGKGKTAVRNERIARAGPSCSKRHAQQLRTCRACTAQAPRLRCVLLVVVISLK